MAALNISKVAVGCSSLEALRERQRARLQGGIVPVRTRFRPTRADELIGGSLYWIIRHRVTARQLILGFEDDSETHRTIIRLDPKLILVHAQPRRAHQGWRYLAAADAPPDWDDGDEGLAQLPPALANELATLALI